VLHTWAFPGAYDDIIMSRVEDEEWGARAKREIQAVLETIDDMVGVSVVVEARHAFASDALIEAGRTSDLLVVGRHDPVVPLGSHLGPVARAVIRDATCPVLLADPHGSRHEVRSQRHAATVAPG
jgi:nucleotide-binding universal stress UspA family protein